MLKCVRSQACTNKKNFIFLLILSLYSNYVLSLVKKVSIDPNANFINIGLSGFAFGEDRKVS